MRPAVLILSAVAVSTIGGASRRHPRQDAGPAVARLRTALRTRDFEGGFRESDSLVRAFPNSPELGALRIALMDASGVGVNDETEDFGLTAEAQDAADSLARLYPGSPWSAYAKGIANVRRDYRLKQVLAFAERALAAQPRTEEFVALKAQALCRMGMNKEAEAFLSAEIAKGVKSAALLALKANAIVAQASGPTERLDTTAIPRGLAAFAAARRFDSTNVAGFALDGPCARNPLTKARASEGYPLLRKALTLAPFGAAVHEAYWASVLALPGRAADEQRAEIEADIDGLLRARPDDPGVLALAIDGYDRLKLTDKRRALAARLLASFPSSPYADQVWWHDRMLGLEAATEPGADSSNWTRVMTEMTETKRQAAEYVARPIHGSRAVLASVYLNRFLSLMSDSTGAFAQAAVRADQDILDGEGTLLAVTLADHRMLDRTFDLSFARQIAYQTDSLCRMRVVNTHAKYTTPGDYADDLAGCTANRLSAVGWIDFKEGEIPTADSELQAALAAQPRNGLARMHRGELLEAEGKTADAETLYLMGGDEVSLRRLYLNAHSGSLDGFDGYLTKRKAAIREQRLADIRATRITKPEPLPRFSLDRFGRNGRVTLDSLKGKLVVVNFWGVWCGPCVMETPQVQKFSDAVKADTDVVFLTIDTRDTHATLADFMASRKFTYPVLFDDGWANGVHQVAGYPTTLFIDRQGRVVYREFGRSDQLVDDFMLRLELLKSERH